MRGEGGVAGEERVVGVFHSWGNELIIYITFSIGFKNRLKRCHVCTIVCKGSEPISSDTGIEKKRRGKKKCYPMLRIKPKPLNAFCKRSTGSTSKTI